MDPSEGEGLALVLPQLPIHKDRILFSPAGRPTAGVAGRRCWCVLHSAYVPQKDEGILLKGEILLALKKGISLEYLLIVCPAVIGQQGNCCLRGIRTSATLALGVFQ